MPFQILANYAPYYVTGGTYTPLLVGVVYVSGNQTITGQKTFRDTTNVLSLDTEDRILYLNGAGDPFESINWQNCTLHDTEANLVANWDYGQFYTPGILFPETSLDWTDRYLYGDWKLDGNITISGHPISTGKNISNYVAGISVTGQASRTGIINFSGLGSVTVLSGNNNFVYISGSPTSSTDHSDGTNLSGDLLDYVHLTGDETIIGVKTFANGGFTGKTFVFSSYNPFVTMLTLINCSQQTKSIFYLFYRVNSWVWH